MKLSRPLLLLLLLSACGGELAELPCTIALEPTGVVLTSDEEGRHPDPADYLVRDSRGLLYSNSTTPGMILKWSASGELLDSLGRRGEGPGEFSGGLLYLYALPGDTLLVRENTRRWTVITPEFRWGGVYRGGEEMGFPGSTVFLPGGLVLDGWPRNSRTAGDPNFIIASRDGEVLRSFGAVSEEQLRGGEIGRPLTTLRDGAFWAAPGTRRSDGYRLEQWDTAGSLIRRLQFSRPWFKGNQELPQDTPLQPLPYLGFVHQDDAGRLVTFAVALNQSVSADTSIHEGEALLTLLEFHLDLIDPESEAILATVPVTSPIRFFDRSLDGYRQRQNPSGTTDLELVTLKVTGQDGGVCEVRD